MCHYSSSHREECGERGGKYLEIGALELYSRETSGAPDTGCCMRNAIVVVAHAAAFFFLSLLGI